MPLHLTNSVSFLCLTGTHADENTVIASGINAVAKGVPALSPGYVPRPKESDLMVRHLVSTESSRQKVFPITGMGGSGKTQIVSHFLQEHPSL